MTVPSDKSGEGDGGENAAESLPCVKDFEIVRRIGKGGFGCVYLAHDLTGHPCALKVITRESLGGYSYEREYDSLRSYMPFSDKHPNLLCVRHVGTGDGFFYYTMPIADDVHGRKYDPDTYEPKTMANLMPEPGMALPVSKAIDLALPILDALEFLHSQNLLHRDVKPSNVLIANGRLVLGDIGLLTKPREDLTCVFSPGYAPPGGVKAPAEDLYSVGMILHEAVGGNVSGPGLSVPTVQCDEPDPLYSRLNRVIEKARSLKYKSASDMRKDLSKISCKDAKSARRRQSSNRPSQADPVEMKYAETGGKSGFLGKPLGQTRSCDDGAGRCRRFRSGAGIEGAIFWHPETGAFELHGEILERWSELGGTTSMLGYPVSDEYDISAETYARDILAKPTCLGDGGTVVIGRGNRFRNGCIIKLAPSGARAKFESCAVFVRPGGGGACSMARRSNTARVIINRAFGILRRVPSDPHLDFIPAPELTKIADFGSKDRAAAVCDSTAAEDRPDQPDHAAVAADAALALVPAAGAHDHPATHLLYGVDPVWALQSGPESFSWAACGGHLFKMTAPYAFFEGKPEVNDNSLAKIRVAVFLPPGHGPETPMVYVLADTAHDMEANAAILVDILRCGFGMVALDTPLTGICQPGVDMYDGKTSGAAAGFQKAYKNVAREVGAKNMTLEFAYHAQRFTARNLWLARLFMESEFGIKSVKTALSGCGAGVATAGFAYNASAFGDMLLGLGGAPYLSGEFLTKMLPSAISPLRYLFSRNTPWPGQEWLRLLDPLNYADAVLPPREVHVLHECSEYPTSIELSAAVLETYSKLNRHDGGEYRFTEAVRVNWRNALGLRLGPGKVSLTLYDGGNGLKERCGEFRTVFLETALRKLAGNG